MAHRIEITQNTGAASFAYSGKIGSAWHRLGIEMPDLSDADTILAAARADYDVHKDELLTPDPARPKESLIGRDELIPTGKYFTWRDAVQYDDDGTPTGSERQVLGIVGSEYQVIQNRAAVEFALEIANLQPHGEHIDCAGVLDNGRRFFATIPLPDHVIDPNGIADRYGRNLVVVTGHDATQSLEVVNGFTRAVCANTVSAALRATQHHIKIRHVATADTVIEAKRTLGLALTADEQFQELAYSMLDKQCDWGLVERVCHKLWPLADDANERTKTNHEVRLQKIHTIWESDRGSGGSGGNHYAAFQTLTEYMEHEQHMVGVQDTYNRAYRAAMSPGFNGRVRKLARAMANKSPVGVLAKS
jgi:phage/plasmid-like protein (TIGR03299 family)